MPCPAEDACQPGLRMGSNHHSEQMSQCPSSAMDLLHFPSLSEAISGLECLACPHKPECHQPIICSFSNRPVLGEVHLGIPQQDPPWQDHKVAISSLTPCPLPQF